MGNVMGNDGILSGYKMYNKDVFSPLTAFYDFYEDFVSDFQSACEPGCNTCCTVDVTCTSIEAAYVLKGANTLLGDAWLQSVTGTDPCGYSPTITINHSASLCLAGESMPDDTGQRLGKPCPFLDDKGLCSIYEYRPFACRAMTSRTICSGEGDADMWPFLIYTNLAMYQVLEHLDQEGSTGNLWDFLLNRMDRLLNNENCPGFLIPPEHKPRFRCLFRRLLKVDVNGSPFSDCLKGNLSDL